MFGLDSGSMSPLAAYNSFRLLTRQLLLSQVTGRMLDRAPKKKMQEQAPTRQQHQQRQLQRRQQPDSSKPAVCRRLFADEPLDPAADGERDNMLNKIHEDIDRKLDAACEKYNFDFRAEVPLEGDWVWERVGGPAGSEVQDPAPVPTSQEPNTPQEPPDTQEA